MSSIRDSAKTSNNSNLVLTKVVAQLVLLLQGKTPIFKSWRLAAKPRIQSQIIKKYFAYGLRKGSKREFQCSRIDLIELWFLFTMHGILTVWNLVRTLVLPTAPSPTKMTLVASRASAFSSRISLMTTFMWAKFNYLVVQTRTTLSNSSKADWNHMYTPTYFTCF